MAESTPLSEDVERVYNELKERIRHRDWKIDKTLAELHKRASALADSNPESQMHKPKNQRLKK